MYGKHILVIWMAKYIFLINHNTANHKSDRPLFYFKPSVTSHQTRMRPIHLYLKGPVCPAPWLTLQLPLHLSFVRPSLHPYVQPPAELIPSSGSWLCFPFCPELPFSQIFTGLISLIIRGLASPVVITSSKHAVFTFWHDVLCYLFICLALLTGRWASAETEI